MDTEVISPSRKKVHNDISLFNVLNIKFRIEICYSEIL